MKFGLDSRGDFGGNFGVRLFVDGTFDPQPLIIVMARCCLARSSKTFLARLCVHLGVDIPSTASLFDILENLLVHLLHCSPDELMALLTLYMAKLESRRTSEFASMLDIEDVEMVLDRDDKEAMEQSMKKAQKYEVELKAFCSQFASKKKALFPADAPAKGKGRGKAKSKGKHKLDAAGDEVKKDLPSGDLLQRDIKLFVPPGGSVWRCNRVGAWASHFPPFRRHSCTWGLLGINGAAIEVLRDLWQKYCWTHGLPRSVCPYPQLFSDMPEEMLP